MNPKFNGINGLISAADPISQTYFLEESTGKNYTLKGKGQKLFLEYEDKEIGVIIRSSLWSGSIWRSGQCIGEYCLLGDSYRIVPIENGLLSPEQTKMMNPVDYLIQME